MLDSLNRGLEIMKYIVINRSASVSEIARVFEIDKSTASRILKVLAQHDLICKDESTMKYYSGIGGLLFGSRILSNHIIIDEARPYLRSLAEMVNMTAQISVLWQEEVFLLEQIKSEKNRYLKEPAFPGMKEPLHCSALGKCTLAYQSEKNFEIMMKDYQFFKYTENTITDIQVLREELAKIKENGYARDMGEYSNKVYCLAVPIYDQNGEVPFCLGVSGDKKYIEDESIFMNVLSKMKKFSEQISWKYSAKI